MKSAIVYILLAVAIGVAYYNALSNGFVFDDYLLVVNHPGIPRIAADPTLAVSPEVAGYRPLRTLSYVVDYLIGGMQPWVFHLSNIIYHWITACVVFLVTLRLVAQEKVVSSQFSVASSPAPSLQTGNWQLATGNWSLVTALIVALLWALHPIQTEAVTYISGRRDILTTLFFLVGFYAFLRLRSLAPAQGKKRWVWIAIIAISYLLALLSKEMAVTLPLVMLAYDAIAAVRQEEVRFGWQAVKELGLGVGRAIRTYAWFYVPLLVAGVVFSWYAAFVVLPVWKIPWYGGSIMTNFLTTARIWLHYLYLLLWPVPLLADYSSGFPVTRSLFDPLALTAVLFLLVLFLVLCSLLRYARLVTFAGLWIALTLLPVSHLIPYPEMVAEHYLYLPSVGFCLLVALGLARFMEGPKSKACPEQSRRIQSPKSGLETTGNWWWAAVGSGVLAALLTFYSWRTIVRNRDWRDNLTFYVRVVADNPRSARARLGLGFAYDQSGLQRMALYQYTAGVRLDPQDPRLHTNMGATYHKMGMLGEAEKAYLEALKLRPQDSKTLNNLGFLHIEREQYDKARTFLEQAEYLSRGRDYAVYANFGLLYEAQGDRSKALDAYRKAQALATDNTFLSAKIAALEKQLSP